MTGAADAAAHHLREVHLREVHLREVPYGSDLYRLVLLFRDAQLRRPLGLVLDAGDVAGEDAQLHFAVLGGEAGSAVCAAVTLKPLPRERDAPPRAKLRQMAVAPACRGSGLGRRLVRFAETAAVRRGIGEIELASRATAVGFYRALGYRETGAPHVEIGLPHVTMRRRLAD